MASSGRIPFNIFLIASVLSRFSAAGDADSSSWSSLHDTTPSERAGVRHRPVVSAELGKPLLKSDIYQPERLQLLKLVDADVSVPTSRRDEGENRPPSGDRNRMPKNRRRRSSNATSGALLRTSGTMESTLHVLEVYPRDAKVTFRMLSDERLERINVDNLDYGSRYESWSRISRSDIFNAVANFDAGFKEVYEDQLSKSVFNSKRPRSNPDELLVVLDGNISLSLHATVFPYSTKDRRIPHDRGWAYVYNALIPASLSDQGGFDIIVYAPHHFKKGLHPLLRLGNNIPLNEGAEILLPEGHYQLKVAHRGTIVDICNFQEILSFIPPSCIEISGDTHQYLVLHGIMSNQQYSSQYPPEMMMVPPNLCIPSEQHSRKVDVYFLNVYQAPSNKFNHPVTFMFPNIYMSVSLLPNTARFEKMNLHDGDCFKVHTKGQTTHPPPVEVDSADSTMCIFLADNNMLSGDMDAFQHCWAKYDYLAPSAAWIFSYNALEKHFPPVDVIVMEADIDHDGGGDEPSILKIMHNVTAGEGMPAMLTAKTYIVKTFLASTIYSVAEFLATPSVTQTSVIAFQPRSYHFNIMYGGKVGSAGQVESQGRILLEPPSPINSTQFLIERSRNATLTPPPVTEASQSSGAVSSRHSTRLIGVLVYIHVILCITAMHVYISELWS